MYSFISNNSRYKADRKKKSQQYPTKRVSLISYDQLKIAKMGGHRAPNHNDYHQTMTGTFFPRLTSTIDDQWISVRRVIHPSIGLVLFSNHIFTNDHEPPKTQLKTLRARSGPRLRSVSIVPEGPPRSSSLALQGPLRSFSLSLKGQLRSFSLALKGPPRSFSLALKGPLRSFSLALEGPLRSSSLALEV